MEKQKKAGERDDEKERERARPRGERGSERDRVRTGNWTEG